MVPELLILLLLVICAVKLWLYQRKVSFAKVLPVIEPCYPLLGNVPMVLGKNGEEQFRIMAHALSNPAGLFRCMMTLMPVLCTNDPEIAKIVVSQCLERPFICEFYKLDCALVTSHYDNWKIHRKLIEPSFYLKNLHSFVPLFEKCAQRLVKRLESISNGEIIDISELMLQCTLEMITASIIEIDIHENPKAKRFVDVIEKDFTLASKRILRIHWHPEWAYKLTRDYQESVKLRAEGFAYAKEILQDSAKRMRSEETNAKDSIVDGHGRKKQPAIINQLLGKVSDEGIIHNIYALILGGVGSTSMELSYAALMLAMFPNLQEKVYQEIIEVLPAESSTPISLELLRKLEYMEMFLKECFRLFPPGPHVARYTTAEVDLNGFKVPPGISIVVSIYNIHRRKDIWGPNADSFDPENFSQERSAGRHPYAYLPFIGGPRNCIGARYAMVSMKIVLVHLVRSFKLKTHMKYEDLGFVYTHALKPSKTLEIYLERREKAMERFVKKIEENSSSFANERILH